MDTESGSGTQPVVQLRRELDELRRQHVALGVELDRSRLLLVNGAVAALAVGLVGLLAAPWVIPVGIWTADVNSAEYIRTGLFIVTTDLARDYDLTKLVWIAGLLSYAGAAIAVFVSAVAGPLRKLAPVIGLAATGAMLLVKPSAAADDTHTYAWQAAPFIAFVLWLAVVALVLTRRRRVTDKS